MITWMQRHKKYLVVTIWISVIAFVGAGTVGWGSVDLNSSRSKYVAKVGNLGVTHKEFNDKYSELFYIQNQLSNGELTEEQALKLGLDKQALVELVREKLLLNYAYDLGFYASEEEVVKTIASYELFNKSEEDKTFDKSKYLTYLKNLRMSEADFANQIKNKLEISKLLKLLAVPANKEELEIANASLNMQDEINLKIIDLSKEEDKIKLSEDELKSYWQEHKDEYKTELSYDYSVYTLNPNLDNLIESDMKAYWENNKFNYKDEEGKIKEYELALNDVKIDFALSLLEKEAKLNYIKLKNNEIKFQSTTNQNAYSELVLQNKDLKVGEMSKPFIMDNKYYIVRLDKINQPTALEFEKAKMMVEEDLRELKFKELLLNTGEEELKKDKINGKNIGFISKVSKNNTDLTDTEFFTFVSELFLKNTKKSYVLLNDKVLVYEILSQKLVDNTSEKNNTDLSNELKNINFTLMLDDLIKELDKRYEIKNYYKGSEF